jgi:Family of unknown function (DUF6489)
VRIEEEKPMKVTIEVDCTPIEARSFLGLPDVSPLHDIYLERMKTLVEQGVTPALVGDVVKSWSTMGDAGMAIASQVFGQFGNTLNAGLGAVGDVVSGAGRGGKKGGNR